MTIPTIPGGWSVVLADPPWRFADGGSRMAPDHIGRGSPRARYATMRESEICALPVLEAAAPDAWLFLWAPNAMVLDGQAAEVALAWGFKPKQLVTWVKTDAAGKPRLGGGHYTRVVTEQLIIATRGRVKPARRDLPGVLFEPRGRHSAKPDGAYALIEQLAPSGRAGRRLELFARRRYSPSWQVWGKESPRG